MSRRLSRDQDGFGQPLFLQTVRRGDHARIVAFWKHDTPRTPWRALEPLEEWMHERLIAEKTAVGPQPCHVVAHGLDPSGHRDGEEESGGVPQESPEHQ